MISLATKVGQSGLLGHELWADAPLTGRWASPVASAVGRHLATRPPDGDEAGLDLIQKIEGLRNRGVGAAVLGISQPFFVGSKHADEEQWLGFP